jgi:class 3 adenylate cyclase
MKTGQEIIGEIKAILATKWQTRKGTKIPEPEDVKLGNDAVLLDGTVLYADVADSTGLVNGYQDWFAAEVYKAYLVAACHVIRNNGGVITAFDGDRVMAVYLGNNKNSAAAKTALQLNWVVNEVNSALKFAYPSSAFQLQHSVGIDTSASSWPEPGSENPTTLFGSVALQTMRRSSRVYQTPAFGRL